MYQSLSWVQISYDICVYGGKKELTLRYGGTIRLAVNISSLKEVGKVTCYEKD